jgi:hypothetical protein
MFNVLIVLLLGLMIVSFLPDITDAISYRPGPDKEQTNGEWTKTLLLVVLSTAVFMAYKDDGKD